MPLNITRYIAASLLALAASLPAQAATPAVELPRWTIEDVLDDAPKPFAIGHRGFGANLGEHPDRPIENTTESVRQAFRAGAQMVEVDVVMTRDGIAVALHDDFLDDWTCVNQLSFVELRHRFKQASKLKHILKVARGFSVKQADTRPSGQVILEIKTPAPLCDPDDTTVPQLVAATLAAVNQSKMQHQVLIESFSPEIVAAVRQEQPEIARILSLDLLQLLTPEQLEAAAGVPVTLLDKNVGLGLQWVQVGPLFRVPIYTSVFEYVGALVTLEARAAALDKHVLQQLEAITAGNGALLLQQLHSLGMVGLVYTVNSQAQWLFLSTLGVDGFYTDDLGMGLALEGQ